MKSWGWSLVLTHHKPTHSNNTASKLENAFIQYKKLLIHVKLFPQVSNIISSLIWEYYMNFFVVMFAWIRYSKQINIMSVPQHGGFQIVSTHTSLSFLSPLGFTQVAIRILPWHLISHALSCLSSPRLLYRPGNTSQPKHNSSRELALVLTASFASFYDKQVSLSCSHLPYWKMANSWLATTVLPLRHFCNFFTSIVSTSIPFMVFMMLREEK